ncbi:MAG: hypothetical protein AAF639_45485, partial [Chloroflexota bacterium]
LAEGVLVKAYDYAGRQKGVYITGEDGVFTFTEIRIGESHIEVIPPDGYAFTEQSESIIDPVTHWGLADAINCESEEGWVKVGLVPLVSDNTDGPQIELFSAQPTSTSIAVRWQVNAPSADLQPSILAVDEPAFDVDAEDEVATEAFELYRSTTGYFEDAAQVSYDLVPMNEEGFLEAVDTFVLPSVVYSYWLVNLADGRTYGPVHAQVTVQSLEDFLVQSTIEAPAQTPAQTTVYLPIVTN